jgi:hypothetical protein
MSPAEPPMSSTDQGGGKRRVIWPCTKSLCNSVGYRSLAVQNHIQVNAIDVVVLRKGHLTSFVFNCGFQQLNNVIIVKYKLETAQTVREGNGKSFVIGFEGHWRPDRPTTQYTYLD